MSGSRRTALGTGTGVLSSAVLLALGTGIGPYGLLAWVALVPVLRIVYRVATAPADGRAARWTGTGAAFVAFLLGQSPFLWAYRGALPLVPLLLNLALLAAVFALVCRASAALLRRLPLAAGVLALPILWTAWEVLLSVAGPHGSAGSLAYSQAEVLPVAQLASIAGLPGITFLLTWVASVLAGLRCRCESGAGSPEWLCPAPSRSSPSSPSGAGGLQRRVQVGS